MSWGLYGWQRLWVVIAVLLLVPFVFVVFMESSSEKADTLKVVFYALLIWASLVGMIYLFGVAVAWIRRGFVSKLP